MERQERTIYMKPYSYYLGLTAEQIMAEPDAPESLVIAARIELQKAKERREGADRQETSR
ncbi:hypothetical protein [Agathobaculum desmolans]|uniref:hypothetical protein n=1 Tax=Agathobaculum desmolans TaxID=39484 RepID=UPI0004E1FB36|nr:hypothetical protein [Agathobaculum desmolans]